MDGKYEVTWDKRVAAIPWTTPGGDFYPTHVAMFNPDAFGWKSLNITDLVRSWVDGSYPNFGVLLRQSDGKTWYHSSEYGDIDLRPKVEICYTIPDGITTCVTIQRTGDFGEIFDASIINLTDYTNVNFGYDIELHTRLVNDLDKRVLISFEIEKEENGDSPGTGTPGYWMNHPESWPVEEITIGDVVYSKDDAIMYMKDPVSGDKTFTMFPALVAAKLNVMIGNDDSCISGTINDADDWMHNYGPVGSGVLAQSDAWDIGEPLYEELDAYNNGELCAPSRDMLEEMEED